jgi:hypothetical protein
MAATTPDRRSDVPDWLSARSPWVQGPSWLLSLVLHVTIAWIVWQLAQSPGCQARRGEQVSDNGRAVGIVVRDPGPEDPAQPGGSESQPSQPTDAPPPAATQNRITAPSLPQSLPTVEAPRVIGAGPIPSSVAKAMNAATGPLVQSPPRTGQGGSGGGAGSKVGAGSGSGTTMYGVAAKGKRFVYVIDRSSSMTDVLLSAKNELMASLRRLDESQEFQVIFFNDKPRQLQHRFELFRGMESDRRLVEQQLNEITAFGGTRRELALDAALKLRPDVIYFLTDSDDEMTGAEREEVRKRLRGAQISCIEFGQGLPATSADGRPVRNFLHKLAEMSGGGYVYVDTARGPAAP